MDIRTERLRRAFYGSGLSQTELCNKTGITKGAMSSYLSGRYFPKQRNLDLLAEALDVSIDYLLGLGGESVDQVNDLFINAYGQDVFDGAMLFSQLDHDDKIRISERISTLLEDDKYKKEPSDEKAI